MWICLTLCYQCQGLKQMTPLLQILQVLLCTFSSIMILIQYYLESLLEGLRIFDTEKVNNSQEWRVKCQYQKCYQWTIKSSCRIFFQPWKKDTITLSMFPDFLIIWNALKGKTKKNQLPKKKTHREVHIELQAFSAHY